jgi:DNA polymerase-3 subunit alpha
MMLHIHSCYQLLESTVRIEKLVETAKSFGYRHIALCDTELFGAQKLFHCARRSGLMPIIGKETTTEQGKISLYALNRKGYEILVAFHNKLKQLHELLLSDEILKVYQYPVSEKVLLECPHTYYGFVSDEKYISDAHSLFFFPVTYVTDSDNRCYLSVQSIERRIKGISETNFMERETSLPLCEEKYLKERYPTYKEAIGRVFELQELYEDYSLRVSVAIPIPPRIKDKIARENKTKEDVLVEMVAEKIAQIPENVRFAYKERIDEELRIIIDKDFTGYLLLAYDFIDCCQKAGAMVGPGRGSAVASLVVHLLGITLPDPIENGLMFERFLNLERSDPPDIDIDVEDTKRQEVIEEIKVRYTIYHVAQIVTFGSFGEKNIEREIERNHALKEILEESGEKKRIINILSSLPKNISTHAAGIILADDDIRTLVPVSFVGQQLISQYDMVDLAQIGITKFDLLGLSTLSFLRETGYDVSLTKPVDDFVYQSLSSETLSGIFQLDSYSGRKLTREFRPEHFKDLRILISLNRPGPEQSGIAARISASRTQTVFKYAGIPILEKILSETYGVPIFQEQIMEIGMKIGDLSASEADNLRKAMAKKKPDLITPYRKAFLLGAEKKHIDRSTAESIFNTIHDFSGYAFNKAHATAYAFITYWTLYIKHYHPLEFYRVAINKNIGDRTKVFGLLVECRKRGIRLLPPDLEHSSLEVKSEGVNLRAGYNMIRNVNHALFERVIDTRESRKCTSFEEVLKRLSPFLEEEQIAKQIWRSGLFKYSNEDPSFSKIMDQRQSTFRDLKDINHTLFGIKTDEKQKNKNIPVEESSDNGRIRDLSKQLSAFGYTIDYEIIFGLEFPPFSTFSGIKIVLVTGVESNGKYFIGSDGCLAYRLEHQKGVVAVGSFIIIKDTKYRLKALGIWEPGNKQMIFEYGVFLQYEKEITDEKENLRQAGVKRISIRFGNKIVEVGL